MSYRKKRSHSAHPKYYIKYNNKFIAIKNGRIWDEEFRLFIEVPLFFESDRKKFTNLGYDEALHRLKRYIRYYERIGGLRSRKRDFRRFEKVEDLNCEIEKILNKRSNKSLYFEATSFKEAREDPSSWQAIPKNRSRNNSDSDGSSTNIESNSYGKHDSKSYKNINSSRVSQHIEIPLPATHNITNISHILSKSNHKLSTLHIPADVLRVIGKWASNNTKFMPYNGLRSVPKGSFENDDMYFMRLLSLLNPTVRLERLLQVDIDKLKKKPDIACSEISQEEFVESLGLIHVDKRDSICKSKMKQSRSIPKIQTPSSKKSPNKILNRATFKSKNSQRRNQNSTKENTEPQAPPKPTRRHNDKLYTEQQDRDIIKYVLKGDNSTKVSGNKIWIILQKEKIKSLVGRSWSSLRNRYLKYILFQLRNYGLLYAEEMQLKIGAKKGCIQRKDKAQYAKNYGLVIQNREKKEDKERHSPIRMVYKKLPVIKKKNTSPYSDSDIFNDDTVQVPFDEYKRTLRRSNEKVNTMLHSIKEPLKNPAKRKLFTQGEAQLSSQNTTLP